MALGFLMPWASTASAAPEASTIAAAADCNGYQPYSYPPSQNGDIITGIGGCGFQAVTVEIWIDVPLGLDIRAGCCPRGSSPVTAYAYCSRTGAGNYYTLARTPVGDFESARRWLC
ncbi:hypothetical protein [Nonomuraea fuscirosea]|uniref:hypothetical protein n=1 Tax=Nonomuraea fuscirosea TaxID=1291556 RepID=UPI00342CB55B